MKTTPVQHKFIKRVADLRRKKAIKGHPQYFRYEEELWEAESDLINECLRAGSYELCGEKIPS